MRSPCSVPDGVKLAAHLKNNACAEELRNE